MRLLLDAMCGRLASYLRMCGHDTAYALARGVEADDAVLALAREEGRTLVTRDESLAARAGDANADATPGAILLRSRDHRDQLRELREAGVALDLGEPSRCGRCNAPVAPLDPDADRPEYVPDGERDVWRCTDCEQCFWKGSHWDRVRETLAAVGGVEE
jgi:hypothetical protein